MGKTIYTLDRETELLIATGAAVAAGCIPCLDNIVKMARAEGIEEWKLKSAAVAGQFIKDKPANMMKASADELLGTHLTGKIDKGDARHGPLKNDAAFPGPEGSSCGETGAGGSCC